MEEVIQVVIFFIIIISVIISRYKEVNSNRLGQVAQNDVIPIPDDEEFELQPPLQQTAPQSTTCLGKDTHRTTPIKHPNLLSEVEDTQTLRKPDTLSEKKSRIRFKTRKEAREAFIYSEIFNRRYE